MVEQEDLNPLYLEIWESQAEQDFYNKVRLKEPDQEPELEDPTQTDFFIFNDGVKQNRDITIIDCSLDRQKQRGLELISKKDRMILRAIRKGK